jgi:phosphohistidine phosphatase
VPVVERTELDYHAPVEVALGWLEQLPGPGTVLVVGHQPHLGLLAGLLLTGAARPLIAFRKGGAALLEFPDRIRAGEGVLHWALTASQLRSLKQD